MKHTNTNTTTEKTDAKMFLDAAKHYLKTIKPDYSKGSFTRWSWDWKNTMESYVYRKYRKTKYIPVYEDFLVINKILDRASYEYKTRYRVARFFEFIASDPAVFNAVRATCKALDAAYLWEIIIHGIHTTEVK